MPEPRIDFALRLKRLAELSDDRMKPFRRARTKYLQEYAGPDYTGTGKRTPLNLIQQGVRAVLPDLVYQRELRAMVRKKPSGQVPFPDMMAVELALNELFDQIGMLETFRRVIVDALFGMGIIKTGVCDVEGPGYLHDRFQPFADAVDLDDYLIDTQARNREDAAFEGNYYFLPVGYAQDSGLYDKAALAKLKPFQGTMESQDGADRLSKQGGAGRESEELLPRYRLLDVWMPAERAILTLGGDRSNPPVIIREMSWQGPETGPYNVLGFVWVPGNVLPASVVGSYFDLHEHVNVQGRKIAREAETHKKIVAYDERAAEDADRIRKTPNQGMVGVQSVERFKELEIGAPVKGRYETIAFFLGQYEKAAGNPSLASGLEAQSKTLGQDQMLNANVSRWIGELRSQVAQFAGEVAGKLAWYIVTSGERKTYEKQESGLPVQRYEFDSLDLAGEFGDMRISVDLYSALADDPRQRYARMMEYVIKVLMPAAPLAASQGAQLDMTRLTEITANALDVPELMEVWTPAYPIMPAGVAQPPGQEGQQAQGMPGQSPGQPEPAPEPEPAGAVA